jgi:hypothetical protein
MRVHAAAAAVLLATLILPRTASADGTESSIRCARGVVSVGDATIDLVGKCGAPALREVTAYGSGAVVTAGPVYGRLNVATSERWTYDFGPQQFLMLVAVEGGKVVAIERGGRGYARAEESAPPIPRATCDVSAVKVGDTKLDVLTRCGDPALMEMRKENLALGSSQGALVLSRQAPRDVEVWTYDFGPQQLVRFVVLADGRVIRVDTGSHGYAP